MIDRELYAYIQKYCSNIVNEFEREYTWAKKVIAAIRHWKDVDNYQDAAKFLSKIKGRKKGAPYLVHSRLSFKIYLDCYFPEKKVLNMMEVE